ncbi:hypothetical protein ACFPYJ_29280 [Paenibacillus solisilvae]|uniref:Uncharacterized protein n=1 Tax=Paenibacillus solisilvae TaxID=2486751 RepID=A0ABW0W754_9BACL
MQFPAFDCIRIREGQSEQLAAWKPYESELSAETLAVSEFEIGPMCL